MPNRSRKDENEAAFAVAREATQDGTAQQTPISEILGDDDLRRRIMREMGSRGGAKGGKARAASLSASKRSEIAKRAAKARWKDK